MNIDQLLKRSSVRGYQLRQGIAVFTFQLAGALGLTISRIHWTSAITTAGINQRHEVYLANIKDDAVISRKTVIRYAGYVLHEMLHRKYTDFSAGADQPSYVHSLHNAVEDAWIEHTGIQAAVTGNIKPLLVELLGDMVAEAIAQVNDWADPGRYPFALAIYLRNHVARKVPLASGLEPIFADAAKSLCKAKSSEDTLKIAQEVFRRLNLPEQTQTKPGNDEGGSEGEGQQGTGKGQDGGKDAPQGQGQGQDTPGSGESQGKDKSKGQGKDKSKGQGKDKSKGEGKAPGKARRVERSDQPAAEVEPTLDAGEDGSCGAFWQGAKEGVPGAHVLPYAKRHIGAGNANAKLRFEVRKLFEDTDKSGYEHQRKIGSIAVKSLHRYQISDRVFKRRQENEGIDSAVVIVLDVSGSMFDQKKYFEHAARACAALVDTLRAAGVTFSIVTFASLCSVAVPFTNNAKKAVEVLERISGGGTTNDYRALRMAHEMLLARPERRKVCFVLTDGCGNQDQTMEQSKSGERLGITTVGIGICSDVKASYTNAIRINDARAVDAAMFRQIKLAA